MQNPKRLNPGQMNVKKPSPQSVEQMTAAYFEAIVEGAETLASIDQSLATIALYFERKGIEEGVLKQEDFNGE